MSENDKRIVMTLDAGGTNFVFSAIKGNKEIVAPVRLDANAHDLNKCLDGLVRGFMEVMSQLDDSPAAISFAFPGPADYKNGVILKLPNLPAFASGSVALGPFLQDRFGLPVFINNDGALFAYGEALCGALPEINKALAEAGSSRRYRNLLGITFGTGFGGGAVIDNTLLIGDNATGGSVWCFRNKKYGDMISEESVSIRAVARVYSEISGDGNTALTPLDIFKIAEGEIPGDRDAARRSFEELGEIAGDVIAQANTIVDGVIVIGGGLTGASKYYMEPLVAEINSSIGTFAGECFPRSQVAAYNLDSKEEMARFLEVGNGVTKVPGGEREVAYGSEKCTGVITSKLGASKAIALGAYSYALSQLDKRNE